MDQDEFRRTYNDVNEQRCALEKSILANRCNCSRAERFCIAEREGVRCQSATGQQRCIELLDILQEQMKFALKATTRQARLPHNKAMRIQVGGLRGLHVALNPDIAAPDSVPDVYGIIEEAVSMFGNLSALPFSTIAQEITAYKGRTPMRKRRRDAKPDKSSD